MPDLHRYTRGPCTRIQPGRWGRGHGIHVRERHAPRTAWILLAFTVLAAPALYLAHGPGTGTAPVLAYLAGLVAAAAAHPLAARWGRR